jgi:hypothetical protein
VKIFARHVTILIVNAVRGVLFLVSALFLAGTLTFGSAFAQSSGNSSGLIGAVQGLLDPQQEQQQQQQQPPSLLPPMDLNETLALAADPVIEPPLQAAQQSQQTEIPEQLPIGDQVTGDPTHAQIASEQQLSDSLSVGDGGIETNVAKSSVITPAAINDGIFITDSVSHSSASSGKVTRDINDALRATDGLIWNHFVSHPVSNPSPAPSPAPSPSPSPASPTGNTVPPKPAHLTRSILDALGLSDLSSGHGPSSISTQSELRVVDNIAISGLVVPPSAPKISVTSPPILQVTPDQDADMTFHSTTSGTYSISIKNDDSGEVVATVDGKMSLGANSASWDGKDKQGNMAAGGSYSYYIRAQGAGGVREPPAEGDGAIVVVGAPKAPGEVQLPTDSSYLLILPIVGAAGVASFFFLRRKKLLTFYLPDEASAVIEDIQSRYPDATVEDYVETTEEGGIRRFKGVTIRNAEADDEWLEEVAGKAKKLAGVDSLSVNYRGKTITL